MFRTAWFLSFAIATTPVFAAITPMKVTILGKPDAPIEGTLYRNLQAEPEDFSPVSGHELVARWVYSYVVESLLGKNPETDAWEPYLAESYEVSKDGMTFTFKLNPKAHWSDGKPVTSDDVRFSYEYVKDPIYGAAHKIPFYEDIGKIDTPDERTISFTMKKKYFKNMDVLAGTEIIPKHIYKDPKAKLPISQIYGSGPYKVEAYNRGKNIVLVRDKNWWGNEIAHLKSMGKFERVSFRFIKDENMQIEMVKKGQIDYMYPILEDNYERKAVGEPFGTQIKKVAAENSIPKKYNFIAWNQVDPNNKGEKHPIFSDKNVRIALSHLLDRKTLIEKFMFNRVVEGRGPVYYKSEAMPSDVKPISYDPKKAKELLKAAGWEDKDKNGVLEKTVNGKQVEFRFKLLLPNPDVQKYFTIYKEALKAAGIDMEISLIEWNTFSKLLDEKKFDAVTFSWGGGPVEADLKQIWHSDSARESGSNVISYKNPEVDKFIDQAREEMNKKKRMALWQKAVRLIAADAPYTYLFNYKYDLFLINSRVAFDKPTYTYDFSTQYWWLAK